jgi:transposase
MGAARAEPAEFVEPDPYRPDAAGLRAWLAALLRRGDVVAAAAWVVHFIARLWAIQGQLRARVEQSKRRKSPSERLRALQAELPGLFDAPAANDGTNEGRGESRPKRDKAKRGPRKRDPHGRPTLPEHLPRAVRTIRVPAAQRQCPCCSREMTRADVEVTERVEKVPAHYVVERTEREVLRCARCAGPKVIAPPPDAVVDRGVLGEDLLIEAAVDHYRDAVPFERMARDARAQGVPLAANTLARGVGKLVDLLDPIVRHVFRRCMASAYLALDATGMPVLDDEVPEGIRRGTLWHLLGDGRWAYFGYAPSGHDVHLAALADGAAFEAMMSDGSPTHNVLERPGRVRAGCHAHARSKLVAAARAGDPRAVEGLRLYAPLFVIEAESKAAGETAAGRLTRRRAQSRAHFDALGAWVEARLGDVELKSPLGKAVRYMRRQWPRLSRFLDDGRIDLTNNEVERDLRTWVLDRKTWLFCGHEQSAGRATAAMTVIVTCAKFGIDPRRYVRDVVRALLAGARDLSRLLPENYVPSG